MSFVRLTMAPSCSKATGRHKTEMTHLVIGNLLMMREVAKHVPGAGSYAPVDATSPGTIDTSGLKDLLASGDAGEERRNMVARAIPLGRFGRPDEVAKAVVFLASDESSFITGSERFADGGFAQV
jgi:NAD(P)-dependent dehydrogenase (short-subunit alcohol dehydrogenase family)